MCEETCAGAPPAGFVDVYGRLRRALRREFEARIEPFGITLPHFMVLRRLWDGDGIAISTLTAGINSDGGTMTGVLDRMEARGLVRRERSTEDRRAVRVFLTEAGSALKEPLHAVVANLEEHALSGLSEVERLELVRLLQRVGENVGA